MQTQWKSQIDPLINTNSNYFVYTSDNTPISNGIMTDVIKITDGISGLCCIQNLPLGNYSINFGGQMLSIFSAAPTSGRGDFYLRDINGNQIASQTNSITLLESGTLFGSMSSNQMINWSGGLLKLSVKITISGGTVSLRETFKGWIQAVPL